MDLKNAWEKLSNCGCVTDDELDAIIESAEIALPYMESRGEMFRLFVTKTRIDLELLYSFKRNRERSKQCCV